MSPRVLDVEWISYRPAANDCGERLAASKVDLDVIRHQLTASVDLDQQARETSKIDVLGVPILPTFRPNTYPTGPAK